MFLLIGFFLAPVETCALQMDYDSRGSNDGLIEINIDTGAWKITKNEAAFTGASRLHIDGSPDYPVVRKWIVLPDGVVDLKVRQIEYEWEGPFKCRIAPYINPGYDSNKRKTPTKRSIPSRGVRIGEPVISDGTRAVPLLVLPVRGNPHAGIIKVSRRIKLTCRAVHAAGALPGDRILKPLVLEFRNTLNQSLYNQGAQEEYLVVSTERFVDSPSLSALLTWKRENGYGIFIADLDTIGSGSDALKDFIISRYEKDCRNVLLIGDVMDIPMRDMGSYKSDHWYACVDGDDDLADLSLGRLSVENEEDLSIQLSKIIGYQKGRNVTDWVESVALVADKEDFPRKYTACKDSVAAGYYPAGDFEFHTVYGGEGKTNCDIDFEFSLGTGLVNYRGHGSFTSWYNWGADNKEYSIEDIEKQMNFARHPVVFSVTCYTGALDYKFGNCFIEALLENRGGASGALGATAPTWTGVNHMMDRKIFDYLLQVPGMRVMDAVNMAKEYIILQEGDEGRENANKYLWLGDPDMFVWTGSPRSMRVDAPYSVRLDTEFFTVNAIDSENGLPVTNAKAVLLDENRLEVHGVSYSDPSGNILLEIPAPELVILQLVVTAPGFAPAYKTVRTVDGLGPFAEAQSLENHGIHLSNAD